MSNDYSADARKRQNAVDHALDIIKDVTDLQDDKNQPIELDIKSLTLEDFRTTKPFEYLISLESNLLRQDIALEDMQDHAKSLGMTGFLRRWQKYKKQSRMMTATPVGNITEFSDMGKYETLDSGIWLCTDNVIYTRGQFGDMVACTHPIMIVERLINIDTNQVKVKIAFRPNRTWREIIVDRSLIASANKIIALADVGIAVTSESAKHLVRYLSDLEAINMRRITTRAAVSRMGWVDGDMMFSPYEPDIVFDGDAAFEQIFRHVHPEGDFEKWKAIMQELRRNHSSVRTATAASFASPLLHLVGALNTFVHFWATTSTGKTMLLKCAASVWGNPDIGAYIKTFAATSYATEQYASFFNSMPLILDELMLIKDKYDRSRTLVYKLTQGVSGGRGKKDGGLRHDTQWKLCCITSGEGPITTSASGAGQYARIIDVHLTECVFNLELGMRVSDIIDLNYGHAGRIFIDALKEIGIEELKCRYDAKIKEIEALGKVQAKQAMTAAALLLADEIAVEYIFDCDEMGQLTLDDIAPHLITQEDADITERAYEKLVAFVASNANRFEDKCMVERYGVIDHEEQVVYIIRDIFTKFIEDSGFSSQAVLSGLAENKYILTFTESGKTRYDTKKRMDGIRPRTVALVLDPEYFAEIQASGAGKFEGGFV